MSSKQMKQLIGIIVGIVVVVAIVFVGIFVFGGSDSEGDAEAIKIAGGYETLKADIIDKLKARESQAATIADTFFDTIGVKKYESMNMGGKRGNVTVVCDGYEFDCYMVGGDFANAYIGNVLVYKNDKVVSSTVANALNYTYSQYHTMVEVFRKSTKMDASAAKSLYSKMTMMGINGLTEIKSGKLNGVKGFYGYEGTLKYFFTLSGNDFDKIYIVCDGFDPILVHSKSSPDSAKSLNQVKVLGGTRQGIANVMGYRCKQIMGVDEVLFPAALLTGDDSWLMVSDTKGTIYLEAQAEIKKGEDTEVKDFIIKINSQGNEIISLKVGRKVYK